MLLFLLLFLLISNPSFAQDEEEDPVIPKRVDFAIAEVMASNFVAGAGQAVVAGDDEQRIGYKVCRLPGIPGYGI